jgi:hypothetical protein
MDLSTGMPSCFRDSLFRPSSSREEDSGYPGVGDRGVWKGESEGRGWGVSVVVKGDGVMRVKC